MTTPPVRLTQLSHGGGCGCKIAPSVLQGILGDASARLPVPKELLVGIENSDDAAVYQINERQAIVATTDFFMPIVDDPFDFGRIAATNAISDIYAMGAKPLFALAVVAMPVNVLSQKTVRSILAGGESVCAEAGIPLAGGHTIDSAEPIYGLVAIGLVDPSRLKKNSGAQPGDVLILGKPIGVGVYGAALKKDKLSSSDYADMIAVTTQLNRPGEPLSALAGVHALTDVTGFGLLGHLLEICKGSGTAAELKAADLPLMPSAAKFSEAGLVTGASARNWASYGEAVSLGPQVPESMQALLTDPQTSGGLLVACSPDTVDQVMATFHAGGFPHAAVIGRLTSGASTVSVV